MAQDEHPIPVMRSVAKILRAVAAVIDAPSDMKASAAVIGDQILNMTEAHVTIGYSKFADQIRTLLTDMKTLNYDAQLVEEAYALAARIQKEEVDNVHPSVNEGK